MTGSSGGAVGRRSRTRRVATLALWVVVGLFVLKLWSNRDSTSDDQNQDQLDRHDTPEMRRLREQESSALAMGFVPAPAEPEREKEDDGLWPVIGADSKNDGRPQDTPAAEEPVDDQDSAEKPDREQDEAAVARTEEMLAAAARAVNKPAFDEDHRALHEALDEETDRREEVIEAPVLAPEQENPEAAEADENGSEEALDVPLTVSDDAPWVLSGPKSSLPACERIFLYTMKPWWGFASEYNLYVSSITLGRRFSSD